MSLGNDAPAMPTWHSWQIVSIPDLGAERPGLNPNPWNVIPKGRGSNPWTLILRVVCWKLQFLRTFILGVRPLEPRGRLWKVCRMSSCVSVEKKTSVWTDLRRTDQQSWMQPSPVEEQTVPCPCVKAVCGLSTLARQSGLRRKHSAQGDNVGQRSIWPVDWC